MTSSHCHPETCTGYPLNKRLGELHSRSGNSEEEISVLSGIDLLFLSCGLVTYLYTDCAVQLLILKD
jgi:hypothetical protein